MKLTLTLRNLDKDGLAVTRDIVTFDLDDLIRAPQSVYRTVPGGEGAEAWVRIVPPDDGADAQVTRSTAEPPA